MLILTRRTGQRILIGDDIILTVEKIKYTTATMLVEEPGKFRYHTLRISKRRQIADGVVILLTRIGGGQIHIGIVADKSIPVNREEVKIKEIT